MTAGDAGGLGAGPLGWRGPALVAFAASVTMLVRLWEGDLHRDEVLYAAIAKGILTRGEWLDLYVGSDPYWRKPPLVFWGVALCYRVLGVSVYSAKLCSALAGVGACVALYHVARRLRGETVALVAGLVLATTPRFVRTSATFRLDSAVALAGLLALLAYLRAADTRRLRHFVLAGLAWGAGVMAKGVFGLTGPFFFLIWILVERRWDVLRSRGFVLSIAVGAAVCLPWHVYQVAHAGWPFLDAYFREQVVDRMMGRIWGYAGPQSYPLILLADDWPWIAFALLGAVVAARAARQGDRSAGFVLAWAGGFLLLLSASLGRRARYLHQLYPPLAILSAMGVLRLLPARWLPALPRMAPVAFAGVAVVLALLPVPLHTDSQAELRALGPVLDTIAPDARTLVAFRMRSLNLRAAALFYLDRDLRNVDASPPAGVPVVLAQVDAAPLLESAGFRPAYRNRQYVLLQPPAARPDAAPLARE